MGKKMGRPIRNSIYSALVRDVKTGQKYVVSRSIRSKEIFIAELRNEGYKVDYNHVKRKAVFDYIINNTAALPMDWRCITDVWKDEETGEVKSNYDENFEKLVQNAVTDIEEIVK